VQAEQAIGDQRRIWQSAPFGLELGSALRHVENHWAKHRAGPEALLCEPVCWAELDYATLRDPNIRGDSTLEITSAGTAHGLLLWFDTILIDEVGFSNAPGAPRAIYGQQLFPWPTPLDLEPGDRLRVELRADQVGTDYRWSWFTEHVRTGQPGQVAKRFRQSDFLATPISPELLRKRSEDFAPGLTRKGELTLHALERMQAGATLGAIGAELRALAPGRFASELEALDFAADLAERHGL
jgi:protein arginine N-methyltransferase 1